jgi:hypothetical protein
MAVSSSAFPAINFFYREHWPIAADSLKCTWRDIAATEKISGDLFASRDTIIVTPIQPSADSLPAISYSQ